MSRKLPALLVGQVLLLGALLGVGMALTRYGQGMYTFSAARSGPAAVWTVRAIRVAVVVVPVATLVGPRLLGEVGRGTSLDGDSLLRVLVPAVVAAGLAAGLFVGGPRFVVLLGLPALVVLTGALLAARHLSAAAWTPPDEELFAGFALATVLFAAVAAGGTVGNGVESDLVYRADQVPFVDVTFSYEPVDDERGRLVVTHAGGDGVPRTHLSFAGTGFANVSGADQTRPGTWQGTASGGESDVVARGDRVAVGVTAECSIWLAWENPDGLAARLESYSCDDRAA